MPNDNALTVGSVNSVYEPWPNTWQWPQTYVYPTYTYTLPEQDYANEVTVEVGEHDATLHFYRSSGPNKGKTLVKTLTIPLGLLERLSTPPQTNQAP